MTSISRQTDITLDVLLQGYATIPVPPSMAITGLTSNSKEVKRGDLFVALAGQTKHAIDFVAETVSAGAVAVIYDANDLYSLQRISLLEKQHAISFIPVTDLQQNLGRIASRFYANPSQNFKLIGVTGTDGKTSVTHLLIQAFNKLNKKAGSVGTLGYGSSNNLKMTNFTTPDAITLQSILFELSLGSCEYVVMEVSSHALEQYRETGCEFDIAVLTNLGSDHLDY
ncbi:MAG: UDP-N-acetylmuramoyl-L-alanyl-D-glutamate--2,6-diaminopimelate ligase, partial [Gammaproteobacteria bacterium]|nr:UDP-N-acetylmuramoyl-L-alanyl-D-glutamate--2,6-diaminopimelate ligase [Gammaproteobacteria bacterium]